MNLSILAILINPALFAWGAAAASVPIIIHLLNRRRFRTVDWAAMRFILESIRKNRRRVRIEELILLALRCLAIFLLAVAVGRYMMTTPAGAGGLGSQAETTYYFILDDSASMGQQVGSVTSFSKAASDLADMLDAIPTTDKVEILLTSKPTEDGAVFKLNNLTDKAPLANKVKSLRASDTGNQLHLALKRANEAMADNGLPKKLLVFGDFRKADFSGDLAEIVAQLRDLAKKKVRLVFYSYGLNDSPNLTIESIELLNKLAVADQDLHFQVKITNNGSQRVERTALSFEAVSSDGTKASPAAVEVPDKKGSDKGIDPGQTVTASFYYRFPTAGASRLHVWLPPDGLEGDNHGYLALDARQARKVLVVDGEPDINDPFASESMYVQMVLDPLGDGKYGNILDVVSFDRLGDMGFGPYDAVMLLNVRDLSAAQLESLTKYVESGGGLVVFTGKKCDPNFYNGPFYGNGTGLLPAQIGAPVSDAGERRKFVRVKPDSIDVKNQIMNCFADKNIGYAKIVPFYGYTPVTEIAPNGASPKRGPVQVLAKFDNTGSSPENSPAVLTRKVDNGCVLMVATSADIEWTDWPKLPNYLCFINDAVDSVSRLEGHQYTDRVGRRISYNLGPEHASAQVTLETPAFPNQDLITLEPDKDKATVTYDAPRQAGFYTLQLKQADIKQVLFARNVDPAEGRMETTSEAELKKALGVEFTFINKMAPADSGPSVAETGREFWKAALAAMLLVLAAEVFLGQRFGHYQS